MTDEHECYDPCLIPMSGNESKIGAMMGEQKSDDPKSATNEW